jgi:glycosyltransferase involved in cell wall biosynthesis
MKILYVINGTDVGGAEKLLVDTASGLRRRGHDASVVSLKPIGCLGEELRTLGFEVHSLSMPERVTPAGFAIGSARLTQLLRNTPCDIVHSMLPRANAMSRIANRMARRVPHVTAEHSLDLQRARWVTVANRATLRWTDAVVAVSPAVRTRLMARDKIPSEKLLTIMNGIDVAAADAVSASDLRGELGLGNGDPIVCSVGRLHPVKGYGYLLRAIALARRDIPHVRLVLVGDGPEAARLRHEARVLGVEDRVHLLGYRRDPVAVIKACHVFALPSLEEGMPLAALEAMAAARPVVGSAVGGLEQVVQSGTTGILVPVADERALARALTSLVLDPELRQRYGMNGRRAVERLFSLEHTLNETETLYRTLMTHRATSRALIDREPWPHARPAWARSSSPLRSPAAAYCVAPKGARNTHQPR